MFQVLTCLRVEHDWRLVVLASAVCVLASVVAISLFHRAQATHGRTQVVWLSHFIAMLAYDPGVGAGYNLGLTVLSLIFAVTITGVGLSVALHDFFKWSPAIGGAIVGGGIAAMHFTGMLALELPGRITFSFDLVLVSLALGAVFGSLALVVAARRDDLRHTLTSAFLLTIAIVSLHFTAMGAIVFIPGPALITDPISLSPASLSLVVAGAAAIILGMCLVAALSDRRLKYQLRQQEFLLDTALENMSQGLCMYDAEGRVVLFNKRYAAMMRVPATLLKGRSLLDLF